MKGCDIIPGSCSNMDLWPQSAVESLCVCLCGCGTMKCEWQFIGKCMCMLLSFMKDRMPVTRDSNHELSLLVSSSTWHGLTMIGQQRTCTLRTLYVILRLVNRNDLENYLQSQPIMKSVMLCTLYVNVMMSTKCTWNTTHRMK